MNIIFKNIEIEGFMSIGHIYLDLDNNYYTLIKGVNYFDVNANSNGSGKSSIWEALIWCLTGSTIRGSKNVENQNLDIGTQVTLNFLLDGKEFKVRRSKNHDRYKTNLSIIIDEEDISGKGLRESEEILKNSLGELTPNLLSNVIILGQGLPDKFTNNSPSRRKEILESLSNSDFMLQDIKLRIQERYKFLNNQLRKKEDELISQKSKKEILETQIKKEEEYLIELGEKEQHCEILKNLQEKYKNINENLTQKSLLIENYNNQLSDKKTYYYKLKSDKIEQINKIEETYEEQIIDLKTKQLNYDTLISQLKNEIQKLENITEICPTCGQKLPNVFKPDTSDKEQKLKDLISENSDCKINLNKILEIKNQKIEEINNNYEVSFKNLETEINDLENLCKDLVFKVNQFNKELYDINLNITQEEHYISILTNEKEIRTSKIKEYKEDVKNCSTNIEQISKTINNLSEHIKINQKFDTAIKRDFRGILLSSVIEFINENGKNYSLIVFNNDLFNFQLDGNNISISYNGKDYEMLSGGERQKVDLIVQLSIRDMLCKMVGFSCNILVLDEVFDFIDYDGCDKIIELISTKLQEVNSIYIISHHADELEIPVDNYITIIKNKEGISELENAL